MFNRSFVDEQVAENVENITFEEMGFEEFEGADIEEDDECDIDIDIDDVISNNNNQINSEFDDNLMNNMEIDLLINEQDEVVFDEKTRKKHTKLEIITTIKQNDSTDKINSGIDSGLLDEFLL